MEEEFNLLVSGGGILWFLVCYANMNKETYIGEIFSLYTKLCLFPHLLLI